MSGVWQDVRYAGRALRAAPGFAAVIVLVLALGIGANVAMFSVVDAALFRSLPYPDADRLVLGRATFGGRINPVVSAYDYWDYRDRSASFEALEAFLGYPSSYTITGDGEPQRVTGLTVTRGLFPALRVRPRLGRCFNGEEVREDGPAVVMISHGFWQRRFGGSPDVLGRALILDGVPYDVVGVMPAGFRFYFDIDVWRPMRPDSDSVGARRFHNWLVLGRLGHGVTLTAAQSEVDVVSAQLEEQYPDSNRDKALLLTGLSDVLVEGYRTQVILLMSAVGLVLMIACGNVAGLLLARGSTRRTELSMRAALGASTVRLIRQLLTESLVLAAAAGALGTALAVWLRQLLLRYVFEQVLEASLPGASGWGLSAPALLFALGISLATGLLFGVAPAIRASRVDPMEGLRSGGWSTDLGGSRFRGALVVGQVALSIVLLVGAGLLIRSFARLSAVDLGYDAHHLLTAEIQLPESAYAEHGRRSLLYGELERKLRAIPGVTDVALASHLPVRDPGGTMYLHAADRPPVEPGDKLGAFARVVVPGYFKAMGIPLVAGRDFATSETAGTPTMVILSRAMAETLFPNEDPIGRDVVLDMGRDLPASVVGVVGDVRMSSLQSSWNRSFYLSAWQGPPFSMRVALRTATDPASAMGPAREVLRSLDRDIPLAEPATMDSILWQRLARPRIIAVALTLFSAVALVLAAVGLYALLAYYVVRRHREIGIRVALGASSGNVVELVLKRGLLLAGAGIVVGLSGAMGLTRVLGELLYDVEPTDPATFGLVGICFGLIALLACLLPAWRALRVDPVIVLRVE